MSHTVTGHIEHSGGTRVALLRDNPVAGAREIILEADTGWHKVGDGVSGYAALPYGGRATVAATTLTVAGWSGNTQRLDNAAILAGSNGALQIAQSATPEAYAALASAMPQVVGQGAGYIMVRANGDVPGINIPVEVVIRP